MPVQHFVLFACILCPLWQLSKSSQTFILLGNYFSSSIRFVYKYEQQFYFFLDSLLTFFKAFKHPLNFNTAILDCCFIECFIIFMILLLLYFLLYYKPSGNASLKREREIQILKLPSQINKKRRLSLPEAEPWAVGCDLNCPQLMWKGGPMVT